MNLQALISTFRQLSGDRASPPLFSDEEIVAWLNEAENEAAERARLLHERLNPDIVRVPLIVGTREYWLHPLFIDTDGETIRIQRTNDTEPTRFVYRQTQTDIEWSLTHRANLSGWADGFLIYSDGQGATARRLVMDRKPAEPDGFVWLSGYRYPLEPLNLNDPEAEPEIHPRHHQFLVEWALYRAYRTRDLEGAAEGRSNRHLATFEEQFGRKTNANVGRKRLRHRAPVVRGINF